MQVPFGEAQQHQNETCSLVQMEKWLTRVPLPEVSFGFLVIYKSGAGGLFVFL